MLQLLLAGFGFK